VINIRMNGFITDEHGGIAKYRKKIKEGIAEGEK
jgi:hypothetical protein